MPHRAFFIGMIALALAMATGPAAARLGPAICSCTPAPAEQRIDTAHKIYIGTVTSIEEQADMKEPGRTDPPVIVTIRVSEGIKDARAGDTELLHESLTRVTCTGHDFKLDQEYLVFAYKRVAAKYELWSSYDYPTGTYGVGGLCGGTKALPAAEADLALLWEMKKSDAAALQPKLEPQL